MRGQARSKITRVSANQDQRPFIRSCIPHVDGFPMASWVVKCPECAHTFAHTAIEASLIEQALRDPFRIIPRPQIQADEKRACPQCKKESVYIRSQLLYRAT